MNALTSHRVRSKDGTTTTVEGSLSFLFDALETVPSPSEVPAFPGFPRRSPGRSTRRKRANASLRAPPPPGGSGGRYATRSTARASEKSARASNRPFVRMSVTSQSNPGPRAPGGNLRAWVLGAGSSGSRRSSACSPRGFGRWRQSTIGGAARNRSRRTE